MKFPSMNNCGIVGQFENCLIASRIVGDESTLTVTYSAINVLSVCTTDRYTEARQQAAQRYADILADVPGLICPKVTEGQKHVFHQYTLQVTADVRDELKTKLAEAGIPSMIYYPVPLHLQEAFVGKCRMSGSLSVSEQLSKTVLSLPMHTELTGEMQHFICDTLKKIFSVG